MEKGKLIGQGRDAEIIYWGNNQVLKHYREGLPKFLIDFEFKASQLVKKYYKYAPKVFEKVVINEREGIIYEFIDGRNLTEILKKSPLKIGKLAKILAKLHGEMHQLKFPVIRAQREYFEERIHNVQLLSKDQKKVIINYLKNLSSGSILCHGDFHMENVLISTNGPKVIDWSNVNVGNHHADVARTMYILRHSYDPASPNQSILFNLASRLFRYYFVKRYIKRYKSLKNISLKQVKKWNLIVYAVRLGEGIIEEQDYLIKQIREEIKRLKLK
ncbi:MAG: aminoglycoside phosphotransferase family protein [Promethearchaeota archaeon]